MASASDSTGKLAYEIFDMLCTMCKDEGKNREAVKYCTDCRDYYCSTCVKVHDTVPVLKGHKIVGKKQFQQGSCKAMVPTDRCNRHGLRLVEMYCENHDCVGCSTCMTIDHRLCPAVFYIQKYIQNNERACNTQNIQEILDSAEKQVGNNLQFFEHEKQLAWSKRTEKVQNIKNYRKEINEKLDELEQASVAEVEKNCELIIDKLEEEIEIIKETKVEVTSAKEKLTSAGSNVSQVFVSIKTGQIAAIDAKKCLDERRTQDLEEISFVPHRLLPKTLNILKGLGQCSKEAEEKNTDDLLQIKTWKKYPVKVHSDTKDCNIQSSCVLDDGTIILADSRNRKLKRLDNLTYSVRDYYSLASIPWQICAINNWEIAVTYRKPEVMFVSLDDEITAGSLIKTDFKCYGLAYADDNLYISDFDTSVYIYSISGNKLKQFSNFQSGQWQFFAKFGYIRIFGLAVSEYQYGLKTFVAHSAGGLITLNNSGQVLQKFNGPELEHASDVHVTSSGFLLVCGKKSNNVLQFGPDGEMIGQVLGNDGEQNGCMSVSCDRQMSKMVVGRERNEVKVYDLV